MNLTYNLRGTVVLVHPDLANDLASRQGKVGVIATTDLVRDEVLVSFGNNVLGLYSSDALLVFKPSADMQQRLDSELKPGTEKYKAITEIISLQWLGFNNLVSKAMKMAAADTEIRDFCMDSLENQLDNQLRVFNMHRLGGD